MIAAVCRDTQCLRSAYRSRDGTDSRREVEPHSLVNLGRRRYLVAWTAAARTGAPSAVDRPARPASSGVRFTPRRLPARDAAAHVEQSITGAPNRYEAKVTLHAAADQIASRLPAYCGTIEEVDARNCEHRTGDDDLGRLALR